MKENIESIKILNTAIIKSKEKKIESGYEERLRDLCQSPVLEAINKAITSLSESQKISRDQSAIKIIDTVRELDKLWNDYILMEGIDKLKNHLKTSQIKTQ